MDRPKLPAETVRNGGRIEVPAKKEAQPKAQKPKLVKSFPKAEPEDMEA